MSTGQGIAGILMNIIQYMILLSLPIGTEDKEKSNYNRIIGTWIFFRISAIILFICCLFVILAYQNKYFKVIMISCKDIIIEKQIDDLSKIDKRTNDEGTIDINLIETIVDQI